MAEKNTTPAPKTFSGQDLADAIGVEGIKLRRHIRSDGTRVGRGRQYKFTTEEAQDILVAFAAKEKDAPPEEDIRAEVEALAIFAPEEETTEEA